MRVLFLCARNRLRSPTAEAVFAGHPGLDVDAAGLSPDAEVPVSAEQVEWADLILAMEPAHQRRLRQKFGPLLKGKRVAVLHVPDRYDYMQPELIRLLQARCGRFFR